MTVSGLWDKLNRLPMSCMKYEVCVESDLPPNNRQSANQVLVDVKNQRIVIVNIESTPVICNEGFFLE